MNATTPRCGKIMQTWNDRISNHERACVRPAGHHGEHWSAERYASHQAANKRWVARARVRELTP